MKAKLIATAAIIGITGGLAVGCGPDDSVTKAPSAASETPIPRVTTPPTKAPVNEKADLLSLTLDDRSAYGVSSVYVTWKIKNTSSAKSDYTFDWQALDKKTGERVDSGTELVTSVLPGQTARGDDVTTLDNANVKLEITSFDRSKSW